MPEDNGLMEKKVTFSWLLSFYGPLLTENQQEITSLYLEEDLSLTEIAQQFSVSRQSVYDTISRTEKQLSELENKLKLRQRFVKSENALGECADALKRVAATRDTQTHLDKAKKIIQELLEEEEN